MPNPAIMTMAFDQRLEIIHNYQEGMGTPQRRIILVIGERNGNYKTGLHTNEIFGLKRHIAGLLRQVNAHLKQVAKAKVE